MSTAVILLTFVIVLGLGDVAALAYIWWLHGELDRLHGSHAIPRARGAAAAARPDGAAPAVAAAGAASVPQGPPASKPPLTAMPPTARETRPAPGWHQETAAGAHANAVWQASEQYLPRRPKPGTLAARTVPVAQTASAPPWETPTGVQPAVDDVAEMHAEYLRSYFDERLAQSGVVTRADMEAARDALRKLDAPACGQAPVARVLGAERQVNPC
jgi:hypothetical protein